MTLLDELVVKRLGCVEYAPTLQAMRDFTARRGEDTPDEFWLLEHFPVYTLGQALSHRRRPAPANGIPLVQSDRGGDITYHGPGQVVLYALVDLARRGLQVGAFVRLLEQAVIDLLGERAGRRPGAPGVYVAGAKVAALGLRVRRGRAYHGIALNVAMDLAPFDAIDPCGMPGLAVTELCEQGIDDPPAVAGERLAARLAERIRDA